jgi:hypothetical protein
MMKLNRGLRIGVAVIVAAAIQLLPVQEAAAEPYSAADMLSECQALLSSAKATADPDAIELDNSFSTGSCWGAFLSIQQLVTVKQAGSRTPMFRVCLPEDTKLVQLIEIFGSFARRHPERQGEPFTIVAIAGLHEAFRCR